MKVEDAEESRPPMRFASESTRSPALKVEEALATNPESKSAVEEAKSSPSVMRRLPAIVEEAPLAMKPLRNPSVVVVEFPQVLGVNGNVADPVESVPQMMAPDALVSKESQDGRLVWRALAKIPPANVEVAFMPVLIAPV